ncbi:MAG: ferrous iron transport protein A [Acutalibacteraceae bacterium]
MNKQTSLDNIDIGENATVEALLSKGSMRRRFLDIGLTPNTSVKCLGRSPGGDPSAYLIRGAVIAIRKNDSKDVLVHTS